MHTATLPTADTVEDVLITSELSSRPSRTPDYQAESQALVALAAAMSDSPKSILQKLADTALELCRAGSAGISVWEPESESDVFRWRAAAGKYAQYLGGTFPRGFSPSGTALDRNTHLLMADPVRFFPFIKDLSSPVHEVLLVPFYQGTAAVGTVSIAAHDTDTKFDAEDLRIISSLTKFASAALLIVNRIEAAEKAEENLKDIRSRMEAALSAGTIGTWNWDVPGDKFFGDASLAQIFSVPEEAVSGGPLASIAGVIHPDNLARVEQEVQRALSDGGHYECDYRVPNGTGDWRWITARGQVMLDANGKAVRFPGVVVDITDRKRAEEELARVSVESERTKRLYEAILNSTPDFVYVFSLDHHILYANQALLRMWGCGPEGAAGKRFLELGYEPWHAEMHEQRGIDQVRATKQPLRGEVPFNGTSGRRIYDYIFVPVIGEDGEVEAVAGTTRDVTDRKQWEDELRETDRKKDDFIALLAHELRNPLAPIRNGLQVMKLAGGDAATIANARSIMDRQLRHMVRLIDDLLDVSRIGRNKMELRCERLLLADVVGNAVEAVRPLIDAAGHTLTVNLPPEPVFLDADLTRLAQVFGNLLTNSTKYTGRGGAIRLSAVLRDAEVIIAVEDNGIGIPSEFLPQIFDMFSQVDRSIERASGGLGIGLAIVKGLVAMHGGEVTAQSDGHGKGSVFTVRLPLAKSAHTFDGAIESPRTRERRRLLIVDDNRDSAHSLATMLRLMGDDVRTAHDGLEAIETASEFRPEVILMDVGMPRMNGLEATRRIKAEPWGENISIIALTGWGQEADRRQSQVAGCSGHLVKPVDYSELERILGPQD